MNKNLYLFVGPSGTGKTTIQDELCRRYGYTSIASYTDRKPRYEGESSHTFITTEEFLALENKVAETFFDGHYYGVTEEMVDDNDLYTVDLNGVTVFKERYHGRKHPVIFVLWLNEENRINRMSIRGDSLEAIQKRIENDRIMFPFKELCSVADVWFNADRSVDELVEAVHETIVEMEDDTETA